MYLLEDEVYRETKKIKSGNLEKSPLLMELSDWFAAQFKVKILNFHFDTIKVSKRNKFRLYIIVDNKKDYEKMVPDYSKKNKEVENLIVLKFKSLAQKHEFSINKRIKNIFVVFNDFSKEAKSEVNEKTIKGFSEKVKSEYPTVWNVFGVFDSLIVFYHLDNEIDENKTNGISETLRRIYYETLKQYDEMNYITRENLQINFDSKENLDKNFDGNLYNYIH